MWILGGMLTTAVTTLVAWKLTSAGLQNAHWTETVICLYVAVGAAAGSSFLAGCAIFRRAAYTREHLCVFSALSGGLVGGFIGSAYAVTLTVAYVASYVDWPDDRFDQVLLLLSYPAFGGLGFCLGAAVGVVLGLAAGWLLKMAPIRRRLDRVF